MQRRAIARMGAKRWFSRAGRISTTRAALRSLLGCGIALALALAGTAAWAGITVDNASDYTFGTPPADGDGTSCTLRKAMQNVFDGVQTFHDCQAPSPGSDTITFSVAGPINLGTIGTLPYVNKKLTITGPMTIKGVSSGLGAGEILHVAASPGDLTLTGISLTNGGNGAIRMDGGSLSANGGTMNGNTTTACCGGAIGGTGTLALANVSFDSNTAPNGSGGAIHLSSNGSSTLTDVSFTQNSANNSGGAIYVTGTASIPPGSVIVTNGFFANNTASAASGATDGGGAIYTSTANNFQLSLVNATFLQNKVTGTDGRGGALFNANSDTLPLILDHNLFSGNSVSGGASALGGAVYSRYQFVARASAFIGNDAGTGKGGAVASDAPPPDGTATPPKPGAIIGNATFQGNTASQGAGLYSFGQGTAREIALVNVTMDGNTASGAAGGGGIYTTGQGLTRLSNTIVSNNTANGAGNNCDGTAVNNVATNLQWPGTTCASDTAITSGNPKLNSPTINLPDVLTLTMSLQAGSQASGAGTNAICAAYPILNFDQRSLAAPIRPLGPPNCDIGAYESSNNPAYGSAPAPSATINLNTLSGVAATSNVVVSETGTDDLVISSYGVTGGPAITVSAGPAAPFTIPDGGPSQTLTLRCFSPTPASASGTLTVNHNAAGSPATYTVNCNVVDPLVITTASPLPAGAVNTAYSQTLAAAGGQAPYGNWQVIAGSLPPGLSLNPSTGALTGTPTTTVGSPFNFTVQVTDAQPVSTTKDFSLTISGPPPLSITTASPLPAGQAGVAYSQTFAASGGVPAYGNWQVIAGSLPPGLSLDPSTGALTGTPTTATGSPFSFTVQVTDAQPVNASKVFSLTINPPAPLSIATASPLPGGVVGNAYSQTFAATGGLPPYGNWQVIAGSLPPGLSLNPSTGALTGTPTTSAGSPFNFTVQVTDGQPVNATKAFSLTITGSAPLSITTASPLPAGQVGVAYNQTFAAAGGVTPYGNWQVIAGSLPPGLSLNPSTGALTGTPTTSAGSPFNFTVQVTDAQPVNASKVFSLTIDAPAPLSITTASPLPGGVVGTAYSQTFAATGGLPPYGNWQVIAGSLPPGLSLNPSTGALTGTPTTSAGSPFNFTVQVTDGQPVNATKAFSLTITGSAPLSITTASPLPAGQVGVAYNQTFAAAGGVTPYGNWQVIAGSLPPGLSLNPSTGALTGTPTTSAGSPFNFTVQVTDGQPVNATKAFSLTITGSAPLSITTTSPLPGGSVGTAYNQTFAAAGGVPPYGNWQVIAGSLPPGLTLATTTGLLSGTPSTPGTYNFTVQVTDAQPISATKAFSITIAAAPPVTTPIPTLSDVGLALLGLLLAAVGMDRVRRRSTN
ncbi:MAG: IPTL-CTERM sorting domain-containing protein [Burkholderiales bacterium]